MYKRENEGKEQEDEDEEKKLKEIFLCLKDSLCQRWKRERKKRIRNTTKKKCYRGETSRMKDFERKSTHADIDTRLGSTLNSIPLVSKLEYIALS
jgi:hypothetical protein